MEFAYKWLQMYGIDILCLPQVLIVEVATKVGPVKQALPPTELGFVGN